MSRPRAIWILVAAATAAVVTAPWLRQFTLPLWISVTLGVLLSSRAGAHAPPRSVLTQRIDVHSHKKPNA